MAGIHQSKVVLAQARVANSSLSLSVRELTTSPDAHNHCLQGVAISVESLQGAMLRVRGEVADLCKRMRQQNTQAANLHAGAHMVRALLQRLKLTNKLRALLSNEAATGKCFIIVDTELRTLLTFNTIAACVRALPQHIMHACACLNTGNNGHQDWACNACRLRISCIHISHDCIPQA